MARTAPVPNIPPIPGMCPSLAVAAGGGDGGGGGGGSGSQGDGSGSGNGDGSGDDANPDGSAADQGQGNCPGGTPCPQHASSGGGAAAGDPVDVVTGRVYTLPATDLFLPGRLPFHFTRRYSSSLPRRDVGFGPGWSHSLAWELEVRRDALRLWTDEGTFLRFDPPAQVGGATIGRSGWRLTRTPRGYEADRNGITFCLEHATGDGAAWALSAVRDRNQATITVERDARGITAITDSVGRRVLVTRGPGGRTAGLQVLLPSGAREAVAAYDHDDRGRLATVTDVLGSRWSYTYDDGDRLTSHRDPSGLTFHYVYDAEGRCVETWGDQHGAMPPGIMPDHPRRLADGTPVKGILHAKITFGPGGYSEVTTSETTRRYFGNAHGKLDKEVHGAGGPTTRTYDELGLVTRVIDGEGLATILDRDHRGRVTRAVDRLGRTRVLERLSTGEVVRETDPAGGTITRTFDAHGNKLLEVAPDGATWGYRYDDGRLTTVQLPNGGALHVRWDDHANLVELTEPSGGVWRSTYDAFGRMTSITSPLGVVRELVRDRAGRVVEIRHDGATVRRTSYDALGRVVERWTPDGGVTRFEHGAMRRVVRSVLPDGGEVRMEHDLENRVRRIVNQKGEAHELVVSRKGHLERERFFDGREVAVRHDNRGMMTRSEAGPGRRVELEHDAEGRLLARTFDGEITHAFTYDPMDRLLSTSAPGVKVTYERDAAGRIVREAFEAQGHAWSVSSTYDPMGRVVRQQVDDLADVTLARDAEERVARIDVAGAGSIAIARDGLGRMTQATLPGGGVWRRSWNAFDLLATQAVDDAGGKTTVDTAFRYDAVQLLRERTDAAEPAREYTYDLLHQLVSVRSQAHVEEYRHDATGNVSGGVPGAPARRYGRGDRLESVGGGSITHDAEGRIVAREVPGGGRWQYQYRRDGVLGRVTAPDGTVTESLYDAAGRRVLRSVYRGGRKVRTTGYVWSAEALVAELELEGGTPRRVRTYLHHDHDGLVLAHHDREEGRSSWRFYLSEPGGMPSRLVDERGRVVERIETLAFGEALRPVKETELRFPGQIHDVEAGLHYNRHRHYDPAIGRYLTPDPVGLWEGLNLYRYVRNAPTVLSDENGLGCLVTITGDQVTVSSTSSTGGDWDPPTPGGSVATAVENTPVHQPSRAPWPPGRCAEASAVDRYLTEARAQPGNEHLSDRELLDQIDEGGIEIVHHDNPSAGKSRTPCPNCRQMLMELGIHPEQDDRIAGNPRPNSRARPLNPDREGASLRT